MTGVYQKMLAGIVCTAIAIFTGSALAAGGNLQIRRISPGGTNVQPEQEIVFQFDRPMVALGNMARKPSAVPIKITPALACQWRWLDVSELACRLPGQARFRPATRYRITVGTTLTALDGAHLAKPVTQTFTTWRPGVQWINFREWRSPVMPTYLVRFNLPVTPKSVQKSLYFDDSAKGRIPAHAEPFNEKRSGPLWLPVPDAPGAVIQIDNPLPRKPLDAEKMLGAARLQWIVTPAKPLASATEYKLALGEGLNTPLGTLRGQSRRLAGSTGLRTYGPFEFAGVACHTGANSTATVSPGESSTEQCEPGSVALRFSAPVPRATLAAVQWHPRPLAKAGINAQWKGYPEWYLAPPGTPMDAASPDRFPLPFNLAAMGRYTITIPAGVKDRFGRKLAEASTVTVRTGHRAPFIHLPPTQAVLEAGERTIMPVGFTNLTKLNFTYRRLFAGDLGPTAAPRKRASATTAELLKRPGLNIRQDQVVTAPLGLRAALDGRSGVVWGTLAWAPAHNKNGSDSRDFFGEVTPYEVFAKVGHFNSLVWVNSFRTGKPVAGAKVRLYAGRPKALDRLSPLSTTPVVTDAQGVAVLPGAVQLPADWLTPWKKDALHYYLDVTKGDAMGLLPLDWSFQRSIGEASSYSLYGNNQPPYGHIRTWAVTEQGLYRPGSEVRFAAFARNVGNAALVPPPALDYTLKVSDPGGNVVLEKKHVSLSEFGGTDASMHIPATATTGWYTITLGWPTATGAVTQQAGRFLVTEFVPASFKVNALLEGTRFGPNAHVRGRVNARLHAGGPYTDAKVKFTARIVARAFSPATPVTSGFDFGGNPDNAPDSVSISQTRNRLDHSGEATTQFTLPADARIHYGTLTFETVVESARGTWVADRASAVYAARDRFIGLRTPQWLLESGKPAEVQYLVVDPDGKPMVGSAVHLMLQHEEVSTARVKNAAGYFTTEQKSKWVTEDECRAVSTAASASCKLTPENAGSYRIRGEVIDAHSRLQTSTLHTWATGPGAVTWKQNKGVTLVPDKSEYQAGDTAHVLVQNPFPGANALMTVERYGVLWKETVKLSGSAPVIDVPIGKNFFPGAYLSVTIFSPRVSEPGPPDLGRPEVALGYIALKITGKGSSLKVNVTPDAPVHKPRQSVNVKVQVHTKEGGVPAKTRLVAVVVNQAVVDLLADGAHYYDPRAAFYAPPEGPDMSNFSLARQLLTRLEPKAGKGENPGGGGGQGPHVRSIFKYATYWNANLVTDAKGRAQFSFKLPDNLTRWRILVMALTPGAAMGLGDANVRVNLPIQVQPALPDQVHAGDRFGAGFNVTNRTADKRRIATHIQAEGPIAGGKAQADGILDLAAYAHGLSWLDLVAQKPGTIRLTGTARSGTLGDALATSIPVRRAEAPIVASQYGSTTGAGASVPVSVPANALSDSAKLDVTLTPTLIGSLDGAFANLRDDPLRFWEVRLSRGVLAADYLRLKPVLGDAVRWPAADAEIRNMLGAAADFQAPNGGIAFWIPRNSFVSPYLSVYTALAFNWLTEMDHRVPEAVQTRLRGYLHKHILDVSAKSGSDEAAAAPILKAAALAALAPTGMLPKGAVAGLLPQLPRLDLFGQALLLDAALGTQDQTTARTIAKSILSNAEESAGSISFNENEPGAYLNILATPLRSNCAVLDALVAYKTSAKVAGLTGDTPEKLMRWIIVQKRNAGGWPNSQENVFCTTAIAHYADAYEQPVNNLTGKVSVANKSVGSAAFASKRAPAQSIASLPPGVGKPFHVKLSRSGKGRLYYNVRLSYALPPDAVAAADAGLTVAREYYRQRGKDWVIVGPKSVLKRGDIVRVDLTVDTPTERHHVVLTDPLPGAFEAVNRQLATSPQSLPSAQPGATVLMFDYGPWPNASVTVGGFYHRETAFDAVRFYADDLPAGHYHLIYAAQVISPGSFIAPAPKAEEIYQPDVFGRGKAQHVQVAPPGH